MPINPKCSYLKKSNVRLFHTLFFQAGGWARSDESGIFLLGARGEWKVSRFIFQGTRKQIQHRASVLLRRRRAALLLSGVDAARMVGACFRVPSALPRVGGGLSFPSSPKKSNVRLFRSRFSSGWVGSFGWGGNLFARSSRRVESFPPHPSRNTKADPAPCFRVAETQAGSPAALRSRCRADGRCLLSRSIRFFAGGGWEMFFIRGNPDPFLLDSPDAILRSSEMETALHLRPEYFRAFR